MIKFGDHGGVSVTPGRHYMLTEGIPIATGTGKRNRCQQLNSFHRNTLFPCNMALGNSNFAGPHHGKHVFPVMKEHAHIAGQIRVERFQIKQEAVYQNRELVVFLFEVRNKFHINSFFRQ